MRVSMSHVPDPRGLLTTCRGVPRACGRAPAPARARFEEGGADGRAGARRLSGTSRCSWRVCARLPAVWRAVAAEGERAKHAGGLAQSCAFALRTRPSRSRRASASATMRLYSRAGKTRAAASGYPIRACCYRHVITPAPVVASRWVRLRAASPSPSSLLIRTSLLSWGHGRIRT